MRIVSILYILLISGFLQGQSSITIGNKVDSAYVGQKLVLPVKINADLSNIASIDFSPLKKVKNESYEMDTVHLEEFLDINLMGPNDFGISNSNWEVDGSKLTSLTGTITLVGYSFGYGYPQSPILKLKDSSEVIELQQSVIYLKPPDNYQMILDSLNIENIKPIIKEGTHWTDFLPILYGILGLLGLGLLGYYFSKRKSKETEAIEEEPEVIIPAHILATKALDELDKKQLWQSDKIKEYQTELTDIMRAYLDNRYEIPAKEMISSDIVKQLVKRNIPENLVGKISDILQIADIVKFAKGTAGPELNQQFLKDAYEWVSATKQKETTESE